MTNLSVPQQIVLELLSDGLPHTKDEIREALEKPDMSNVTLRSVIYRARRNLAGTGQTIVCEYFHRKTHYRWVRLLSSGE